MKYKLEKGTKDKVNKYSNLTYPSYREKLGKLNDNIIVLGCDLQSTPIGLALAETSSAGNKAEILSLFVIPEFREQGVGKLLLEGIEKELLAKNCKEIKVVYTENTTTSALEKILAEQNWNSPEPRMLVARSDCMAKENQSLKEYVCKILKKIPLPSDFNIFPWVELSDKNKDEIAQQNKFKYPKILNPFQEEDKIEPLNSLALSYQGGVVGWLVNHRLDSATIRYTSLFIKEDLKLVGRTPIGIPLLFYGFLLQIEKSEAKQGIFTVKADNLAMLRLTQKTIKPYLASCKWSKQSFKQLA